MADYGRESFAQALHSVGLRSGDVVFSHSNIGFFGLPQAGKDARSAFETVLGAFQDVLGTEGTLVVPTFSYSFCKRQLFDPGATPSDCGIFTEMLRQQTGAHRSVDPIFSVAAIGARAEELTRDAPAECFGEGSFWHRFLDADGVICNLNFDAGSTFLHFVERRLGVPYRYDKLFTGVRAESGGRRKAAAVFFCSDMSNEGTAARFDVFDSFARERAVVRSAKVGRGSVNAIRAADAAETLREGLERDPWMLTASAGTASPPSLIDAHGYERFPVSLEQGASMMDIMRELTPLPRDIISDGYDSALYSLANLVPMQIHQYPTGSHCWTWIVPEKWECDEAYLETMDGQRLLSYADNLLHVMSYSLPLDREVSREELFAHLHVHSHLTDAVPFRFKYYERDWGLCCSQELKDSLTDDSYRVVIRSRTSYGTLKVGEVLLPGKTDERFVLCAHLCHPAMANDGLVGVAVGIEVMRRLARRSSRRLTYQLLILPETIGSVSYLSHNPEVVGSMTGGLFLEMLGLDGVPHALQRSLFGDSTVDGRFEEVLVSREPDAWVGEFLQVITNDERQFNAPGVRVPMLSLSRVLPADHPHWPYKEYHSDRDDASLCSEAAMEASVDLIIAMIDRLEADVVPRNLFSGEVFCSRYAIHLDWEDSAETQALFDVMFLVDGVHSVGDIARLRDLGVDKVMEVLEMLEGLGLVQMGPE